MNVMCYYFAFLYKKFYKYPLGELVTNITYIYNIE